MRNKQKYKKWCASAIALMLVVSMTLGIVPAGTGQVYAADTTIETEEKTFDFLSKTKRFFSDIGDEIGGFFSQEREPAPAAAFDAEVKVDPNTLQTWQPLALDTTENIGRIWTDKTVATEDMEFEAFPEKVMIGDSQFLIALSALSSTSNMVTTSAKPLDIMLVLDVSGSMEDELGTEYIYEEAYNFSWRESYYAKKNDTGEYVKIERYLNGWRLDGEIVNPKESKDDNTEGRIQFYTRRKFEKMDALKMAVNNFATATAQQNDKIQDKTKQHYLSVVTFSSDSRCLNPLTAYDSNNISNLTEIIDGLNAKGATASDYGLETAKEELEKGRVDAQKVVIFFTDGEPNHANGFDPDVANDAIKIAKELKGQKALLYSIGVFEGADPDNTSTTQNNRFNAYMHGVSSNYPNATKWNELGERAADSNYYKAASSADELNQIFEDILNEVNTGSGFPTEIPQGYEPNKGGYVTFDDQLGAYMQVDEFKSILFADRKFDLNKETGIRTEGNVTTYVFEGEGGNALYPKGNLHDILITVTRSDDLAVGDKVKVQIPAAMIPLRHFKVDTDVNGQTVMTIDETWPIRIMYGASVKSGVVDTLKDGLGENPVDVALKEYLRTNSTTIGNKAALFYSNAYTGKQWVEGKTLGDTIASFEPAKGNCFYYFTEDTPIYTDDKFENPVMETPSSGDIYYYKKTFWSLENGKPVEKMIAFPFASDNFEQASANWGVNEQGEVYIKEGSARLTRVDSLTLGKEENRTGTATEVINPQWDNVNNPHTLHVYLGNNGSIAMEVPGALEITKDATVAAGKNLDEENIVKDKEFAFQISIPDMKGKTVKAEKRNLQGEIQGEVFDLSFSSEGNVTIKLKDNERLYIHGLDAGASYTVTEDEHTMPEGFALTSVVTGDEAAQVKKAEGTIEAGVSKKHTFVNTYDVEPVSRETFVPFEKKFDRWDLASSFQIMLMPDNPTHPMPEGTKDGWKVVEVKENEATGNFGKITFTAPGTYGYTVVEKIDDTNKVIGVDYSLASYDVEVKVSDNGDGTLQIEYVQIKQLENDDGTSIPEDEQSPVDTAVFTNTFEATSSSRAAIIRKDYKDTTGGSLKNGQFSFKMTPRKDLDQINNPDTPNNRPTLPEAVKPDPTDGSIIVSNNGGVANFGMATYGQNCVGNTYVYELQEVVPAGVTADKPLNGMTYDLSRYLVKMTVTSEAGADGNANVVVTPTYYKIKGEELEQLNEIPVFHNVYNPKPFVLPDEGNAAIHGSKTLIGRDSLEQEEFQFTLSAANEMASTGLKEDWIVFENEKAKTEMNVVVTGLTNGEEKEFNFGSVQFTHPGIYQFNVVEKAPENDKGMVYDRRTALVTVEVTNNDEKGTLEGHVTYNNGQGASTDKATFINTYTASATYGDGIELNLSKTLNGRDQKLGEFSFQIVGKDEAASVKLTDADKEFTTNAPAGDGVSSVIFNKLSDVKFDEKDAGKTFSYVVKEVLPEDDDEEKDGIQKKGVTYTQMQYKVDIQVYDNGDGTMHTETTIYRTHDDDGKELKAAEKLGSYNSADGKKISNDITFVNRYGAKSVTIDTDTDAKVKLTKQLLGRSWKQDDVFRFTLKAINPENAPLPMKDGEVTTTAEVRQSEGTPDSTVVPFGFGTITFDKPGNYNYQVTEEHAGEIIRGITYDPNPANLRVRVTDSGEGQLTAVVNTSDADFVNTYDASLNHNDAGGIATEKTLHGRDMEDRQFTFQVEALEGVGTTAEENAKRLGIQNGTTATYRNDGPAKDGVTLSMKTKDGNDIQFTIEDIGKTLVYKFSEMGADGTFGTGGTKNGYTYDHATYTIELYVTDDGDGTLTLHTKVTDQNGKVTEQTSDENHPEDTIVAFVNSYAGSGVSTSLAGTKKMNGAWDATGKDLSGFQFRITGGDEDTNAAIKEGKVELPKVEIVTSDEEGNFTFDSITFKKKGTYRFTISEVVPEDDKKIPGVAYDAQPVTITFEVKDNGDGTFTPVLEEGSPALEFVNTYATTKDATFIPTIGKKVEGLDAEEHFKFKISAADESTQKAVKEGIVTGIGSVTDSYSSEKETTEPIAKGQTQTISFEQLTFKKAGTYRFTVKETFAVVPTNWNYDSHTYELTIEVTDDNSELKAMQKPNLDALTGTPIFTNRFSTNISYEELGGLNVIKKLNGRTLEKDMFTFTITGMDSESVTKEEADAKLTDADKSFKNTAQGKDGVAVMSKLGSLKFDQTDIGKSYQYEVREIAGTDTKYSYDPVSAVVEIQVLEKDGELYTITTVTKGDDLQTYSSENGENTAIVPFVNSYTPELVTIDPGTFAGTVRKVLQGNRSTGLQAGEFEFQMNIKASEGSSIDNVVLPGGQQPITAVNKADGSVSFGNIQFKAAGTYHVEIRETIPDKADSNMTYDKHTFSYDIVVTYDVEKGLLSAEMVEESVSGSPIFTNIYEADDAKDVISGTGDTQTSVNGQLVGVGDLLTYTINWVNNAVDDKGQPTKATVTVTDKVPVGTEFVSAENNGKLENGTITWSLGEQEPGASGIVAFTVKVTEDAATEGTVENIASITIGTNDPKTTNTTTTYVPGKTITNDSESPSIKVGDTITYTITYHNPESTQATVIIRDSIPEGTDYVAGSAGEQAAYDEESRTLTWTLKGVEPHKDGKVTFKAVVNESAMKGNVENKATVQIGENGSQVSTNTETFATKTGAMKLSKEVRIAEDQEMEVNKDQIFEFTVKLTDTSMKELSGAYLYKITGETDNRELKSGEVIPLKHGQSATIEGLPEGAVCTMTEKNVSGYTSEGGAEKSITVVGDKTEEVKFVNIYQVTAGELSEGTLNVKKVFIGRDWRETDRFAVQLEAKGGSNASGQEMEVSDVPMPEGAVANKITLNLTKEKPEASFGSITYSKEGTYRYTVTEIQPVEGVLEGVQYSKASYDVIVVVEDNGNGTLGVVVQGDQEIFHQTMNDAGEEVNVTTEIAVFTNTYEATMSENDKIATNAVFAKELIGRDWIESDSFTFHLTAVTEGAPLPKNAEGEAVTQTTVTAKDIVDGKAKFSFGMIEYTLDMVKNEENRTKDFVYEVSEVIPNEGNAGVVYDTHKAKLTITVTDDGKGNLTAGTTIENSTFTNTYKSSLNYNSIGGLQISKTLNGRDMQTGQFTFAVTPKETVGSTTIEEAAQKLGLNVEGGNTFTNGAAAAGTTVVTNILTGKDVVFTQADSGKTYTYEVTEIPGENRAYTYDSEAAVVTITVADNQNATLTVTTVVTKGGKEVDRQTITTGETDTAVATIPFVNVYNAQPGYLGGRGNTAIQAVKTLTNRPLVDGEFAFHVLDKNNHVVTSGVNDAAGNIVFDEIAYTTEKLNADAKDNLAVKEYHAEADCYVYSYTYKVVEDITNAGEGITGITTEYSITVRVTDKGTGTLDVEVVYPEGTENLVFENAYGMGAEAQLSINGQKILNVENGNNAPDITGKFEFTIEGSQGAPMPEKLTAVNDASGNVNFGKILYTMQNVFGDDGVMPTSESRTKTFTYTIKERGSVEGVTNDTHQTFTVSVTDNGDGSIRVSKDYEHFAFIFTNTYSVMETTYSINTDLAVTKTLTGRDMKAGEFVFELISDKDKSIREAVNDENGNVIFESITYTVPGEYTYTLRERNMNENGIEYDAKEYKVVVKVIDNGDGSMSATATTVNGAKEIVFENTYKPVPTAVVLGASKILRDGDLKDGQFTFLLKDMNGKVVDEVFNNQEGQIVFKPLELEKEGSYKFTISEKNDKQKDIVYDETEYGVTIEVTDDTIGHLSAVIHYEEGVSPTFINKNIKSEEPEKPSVTPNPSTPDKPEAVQTGDTAPITGLLVIMVVSLGVIVVATVVYFKNRRKKK